jgi:hypothetical protein
MPRWPGVQVFGAGMFEQGHVHHVHGLEIAEALAKVADGLGC